MSAEKIEKTYDKPRITSTIVISILFLATAAFTVPSLFAFSWKAINEATESGTAGDVFVALFAAFGIVLYLIYLGAVIVECAILLPFSISNRKSTLKPVRIISYVLDVLIGALILASIIKIILLASGV